MLLQRFSFSLIYDILALVWPIFLTFILQNSIGLVSIAMIGHLGMNELSAASLGYTFSNITGFSVGIGFMAAMDTLCSQAFGGQQYATVATITQRAILIMAVLTIPIILLWCYTENILIILDQSYDVSVLTGKFMIHQIYGLYPNFLYIIQCKFLTTQGITEPPMYTVAIVALLHPFICYFFIYHYGFIGASAAISVARIFQALILFVYITSFGLHKKTWKGWTCECLKHWDIFISMGIPSCIMVCAEWWAVELMTIAAGWVSPLALSIQAILGNLCSFLFCVPLSFTIACGIKVGHYLGAGEPIKAHQAWIYSQYIAHACIMVIAVCLFVFQVKIVNIFTDDKEIIMNAVYYVPVLCAYILVDTWQSVAAGALRGAGRQSIGAWSNLFSYYIIGIPVGYYMAFSMEYGYTGLWIGNSLANLSQAITLTSSLLMLNWTEESKMAHCRLESEEDLSVGEGIPLLQGDRIKETGNGSLWFRKFKTYFSII